MATIIIPILFGIGLFSEKIFSIEFIAENIQSETNTINTMKLESENQQLKSNIQNLKQDHNFKITNLEKTIKKLETKQPKSQQPNTELENEIDRMDDIISDLKRENQQLKSNNNNSKEKPTNPSEIKKLDAKIKQLQKELDKEKSKKINRDRTEKEDRLEGDLNKALKEITDLKNENKKLKDEKKKLKDSMKK